MLNYIEKEKPKELEPLTPETDNLFLEYIRKGYTLVTVTEPHTGEYASMGFVDPATYDPDERYPDFILGTPLIGGGFHTITEYFTYITKRASGKNEVTEP